MTALFEVPRIEGLLTQAFGTQVKIAKSERLAPWFVMRCAVASEVDDVPTSVIVKVRRDGTARSDPMQVCTERAALEFVDELGERLAPRLIASDLEVGILVLEDLAPRISLAEILKKGDAGLAREGLLAFARTLGTLHSVSSGRKTSYYARRRALGPVDPEADRIESIGWKWSEACAYMESLGVSSLNNS